MADLESTSWDETDANNTARFPEGQNPSTVNDGARALEGAIKREWNRMHATKTSAGASSLTFTVSYSVNPSAYVRGVSYAWRAHQNCDNAARFGISGLATKLMMKPTRGGMVTISQSDIVTGQIVRTEYDTILDAMIVTSGLALPITIGTVQMVIAGAGLSGGSISGTGTLAFDPTEFTLTTTISTVDQMIFYEATAGASRRITVPNFLAVTKGRIIQTTLTVNSAVATGTTQIPQDDTIPQNTEGDEYMNIVIVPTNANNLLYVIHDGMYAGSAGGVFLTTAMFQAAGADAIAAAIPATATAGQIASCHIEYLGTAGVTTTLTFTVRTGGEAATTVTFNGQAGARLFGTLNKSRMIAMEIAPAL